MQDLTPEFYIYSWCSKLLLDFAHNFDQLSEQIFNFTTMRIEKFLVFAVRAFDITKSSIRYMQYPIFLSNWWIRFIEFLQQI